MVAFKSELNSPKQFTCGTNLLLQIGHTFNNGYKKLFFSLNGVNFLKVVKNSVYDGKST